MSGWGGHYSGVCGGAYLVVFDGGCVQTAVQRLLGEEEEEKGGVTCAQPHGS